MTESVLFLLALLLPVAGIISILFLPHSMRAKLIFCLFFYSLLLHLFRQYSDVIFFTLLLLPQLTHYKPLRVFYLAVLLNFPDFPITGWEIR